MSNTAPSRDFYGGSSSQPQKTSYSMRDKYSKPYDRKQNHRHFNHNSANPNNTNNTNTSNADRNKNSNNTSTSLRTSLDDCKLVTMPNILRFQKETDAEKIKSRQKQIDFGKNTIGYDNYLKKVPKDQRAKEHPRTPDKYQKCSRRSWLGQVKKWRRELHSYDPSSSNGRRGEWDDDDDDGDDNLDEEDGSTHRENGLILPNPIESTVLITSMTTTTTTTVNENIEEKGGEQVEEEEEDILLGENQQLLMDFLKDKKEN